MKKMMFILMLSLLPCAMKASLNDDPRVKRLQEELGRMAEDKNVTRAEFLATVRELNRAADEYSMRLDKESRRRFSMGVYLFTLLLVLPHLDLYWDYYWNIIKKKYRSIRGLDSSDEKEDESPSGDLDDLILEIEKRAEAYE